MRYEQMKKLSPATFKRRCGVIPETFQHMVALVSNHQHETKIKTGRPPKLSVEDQVLLTLEYWREGRAFFYLANSWGLHTSSVRGIINRVKDVLTKSQAFTLPGKKKPGPIGHQTEFIVAEIAATPNGRPKKSKKPVTSDLRP